MNIFLINIIYRYVILISLICIPSVDSLAQGENVVLTFHVYGVYKSKISLLTPGSTGLFKKIQEFDEVHNSETIRIIISKDHLPGELVIRFDYKEKETSSPYPCEKFIFINNQDIELWVNPMYCNNPDSTWFQKNERENTTYAKFSEENSQKKEKIGLLQNFLLNYDDPYSEFYQQGILEYEKRRNQYNQWLQNQITKDSSLFVSNLYRFEYVPAVSWTGKENERIISLINHYFDGMDFNSTLLIKTSDLRKWMDNYVNLYGQLSTTTALRDSLFSLAGKTAIEKAKKGNPVVYGWMVDYFYRGYETNGITAGMKILEPYLIDPNCLTTKRLEINRRLQGMKTLLPGTKVPDISIQDNEGNPFDLYSYKTSGNYQLLLFWSAGCSHCVETVNDLYPLHQQNNILRKMDVIAIGLDESDDDIKKWKNKISELPAWKHLGDPQGVNGKVAIDYFILSTPAMILIRSDTKEIIALPVSIQELISAIPESP